MRLLLLVCVIFLTVVILTVGLGRSAPTVSESKRCPTGQAHGFAAINPDPPYLVGTIPSTFRSTAHYFLRRFNCLGRGVEIRRLDEGVYEVRFPGLRTRVAVASAISDEGVAASWFPFSRGVVRVVLRGPLIGEDIVSRRDVAFSVVVF